MYININSYSDSIETIEIRDGLKRYHGKGDISKNNTEFYNLIDKVVERQIIDEIGFATQLLVKFGNMRFKKMEEENNPWKKKNFPNIILPYYRRALEIGSKIFDFTDLKKRIVELESLL